MKKLCCILLSICMLLSVFSPFALAAAPAVYAEEPVADALPVIVVRGMDFTQGLKYHFGQADERTVNVMNNLSVGGVLKALGRTAVAFMTRGKDAAVGELLTFATSLFEGYACDENGNPLDPEITGMYYPLSVDHYPELWEDATGHEGGLVHSAADRYGADKVYYFLYDWRIDTYENAFLLNEMIDRALADHGCDQVNLVCCSMGGIITLTYMRYYGTEKLHAVAANSSTMYGTDVTTDLLTGKVLFETDAAYRYLLDKLPGWLSPLVKAAYKVRLIEGVCGFLNRFAENYKEEIYAAVLTPIFGTMPAFWELVRHESYEDAKAFVFGENAALYAGLLAKTDKIQYEVAAQSEEILRSAMEQGMIFGVLANYNSPLVPAYASAALQGDGTLETRMMSFGALVSEVGHTLSEAELAVGDAKYVSPDRCINASTALFRDETWFTKDCIHVACRYHSDYTYLIFSILESAEQPTVETWEKYPQFMQADGEENLSPATDAPGRWD